MWVRGGGTDLQLSVVMFPFLSLLSSGKQHRDVSSPVDTALGKNPPFARNANNFIDGESPHLPKEMDHSLGIAREEVLCFYSPSTPLRLVFI